MRFPQSPATANSIYTPNGLIVPGGHLAPVSVRLYATLRSASGTDRLSVDASSLLEVDRALRKRFGAEMERLLGPSGTPFGGVVVLVNGVNVPREQLPEVSLREGDEVAVFPPVSGG